MTEVPAGELRRGDVIRVSSTRRGLGRKAIVLKPIPRSETIEISYAVVIKGDEDSMISANEGLMYARPEQPVPWLGRWDGIVTTAASGRIVSDESTTNGEGHMATATKGTRKSGSKSGSKAKASNAKAATAKTRASNEELDELAAKVVKLRDSDGKSWGDIGDELDIAPGRLRQLYNRGGGKPNRVKAASTKAAENGSGKTAGKKGSTKSSGSKSARSRRKDPSKKG
jgi:hypothetical protein